MSAAAAFAGRTFDVAAFRGQRASGEVLLASSLAGPGDGGEAITGVLKVAQWFVVEFLTAAGSLPYDPARGTGFVPALISGALRTETDAFVAFGFAVGTIRALAAQLEPAGAPADERFASAVLDSATIVPGSVSLHITLTTAAGTSRAILLPVATIA